MTDDDAAAAQFKQAIRPASPATAYAGAAALLASLGGILTSSALLYVGPLLGLVSIMRFVLRRDRGDPGAPLGLVLGMLAIALPALLWLAWMNAGD